MYQPIFKLTLNLYFPDDNARVWRANNFRSHVPYFLPPLWYTNGKTFRVVYNQCDS